MMTMKRIFFVGLLMCLALARAAHGQRRQRGEADFLKEKPAVGEPLPDVTVYDENGKEVRTASLRGHYTVLTFGCLT